MNQGNNQSKLLIQVARVNTYATYNKNKHHHKWFDSIFSFIESHNTSSKDEIKY